MNEAPKQPNKVLVWTLVLAIAWSLGFAIDYGVRQLAPPSERHSVGESCWWAFSWVLSMSIASVVAKGVARLREKQ